MQIPPTEFPKNAQQLFDIAATHLLNQSARCTNRPDGTGSCVYRGEGGMMCAIGACIPDSFYSPDLEGAYARSLLTPGHYSHCGSRERFAEEATRGIPENTLKKMTTVAQELQIIHDRERNVTRWMPKLRRLARAHRLKQTALDNWEKSVIGG